MARSFEELLLTGGLPSATAEKLALLPRPAVRLSTRRVERQAVLPLGTSRFGGQPDLASGFRWPTWKGRPLAFLGQVNLADVAGSSFCSVLPTMGLLSFFYDKEQETWGFDPKDRGSWLVHFEPNPDALCRSSEAGLPPASYPTAALTVSEVQTLPSIDSQAVAHLMLSPLELDIYSQVLEQIEEQMPHITEHQLLGHAAPIQGDMQLECQLASNGVYCGDPTGYESPRGRELAAGADRWQLLMQIDSDDSLDMMWGDYGRLYFWVTNDALQRRAFGDAWMILQCS